MMTKLLQYVCFILIVFLQFSCAKEYSFEGGGTPIVRDSMPAPIVVNEFPFCPNCVTNTGTILSEWSFKSSNSVLCGKADTAIINPERNAFTFFGPSSCSPDTGMVVSVYLEGNKLNRDISNLTTNHNAFYYYEKVTPSYIFMNPNGGIFTVTISNYNHQTKIATGTFLGYVNRITGGGTYIESGRFTVKLL